VNSTEIKRFVSEVQTALKLKKTKDISAMPAKPEKLSTRITGTFSLKGEVVVQKKNKKRRLKIWEH